MLASKRLLPWLLSLLGAVLATALAGCASPPPKAEPPPGLLDDARFAPPARPIDAGEIFALSEPMQRFLREDIATLRRRHGDVMGLVEALRTRSHIQLDYDAERTRNASEAFASRSGNCLALVVMATAFADALRLPVRFNLVLMPETWSRNGDLYLKSGHVNLTIDPSLREGGPGRPGAVTIDFVPPEQAQRLRSRAIGRATVVAMFFNNRAVEALAAGGIDDAYAWAAAAVRAEPAFAAAYNTLGVVYLRHGDLALAEQALKQALAAAPDDLPALSNLAAVADRLGRADEARALRKRLAALDPHPPFHFFDLGRAAMARNDFTAARELFEREAARDGEYHEFQFWLALANLRLGDAARLREHLKRAIRASPAGGDRQRYEAKLSRLREAH
ncbi:MAG TPA: tetratricopeptide repeat protein [Methylibium sp.]|uniref:tetratricopeptide repeat protein n=1 Tax=Methylibium sp. TaxID=2067992 RepID=UPI002DB817BD|nr:tetratricopeptide repeat protein [Methylibium sp.]HEU4458321.1 tetratricopeptide repeat protein [Methylibium sp.]